MGKHTLTTISSLRRALLGLLCALLLGGVAFAGTAHAINTNSYWNSKSVPLKVTGHGSTAKAYGFVKVFHSSNGTKLGSYGYNTFTDADNHRAYTHAISQFNAGTCSTHTATVAYKGVQVSSSSNCWAQFADATVLGRADGLNYTTSAWVSLPGRSVPVHRGADQGRARVRLCIDIPWRSDPCTGYSYSATDSW